MQHKKMLPWGYFKYIFQTPFTLWPTKDKYWRIERAEKILYYSWAKNGNEMEKIESIDDKLPQKVNSNRTSAIVPQRLMLFMERLLSMWGNLPDTIRLHWILNRIYLNTWNNNYAFVVMIPSTLEESQKTSQEYLISKECFCLLPTHFSLWLTSWLCKQIIATAAS